MHNISSLEGSLGRSNELPPSTGFHVDAATTTAPYLLYLRLPALRTAVPLLSLPILFSSLISLLRLLRRRCERTHTVLVRLR